MDDSILITQNNTRELNGVTSELRNMKTGVEGIKNLKKNLQLREEEARTDVALPPIASNAPSIFEIELEKLISESELIRVASKLATLQVKHRYTYAMSQQNDQNINIFTDLATPESFPAHTKPLNTILRSPKESLKVKTKSVPIVPLVVTPLKYSPG